MEEIAEEVGLTKQAIDLICQESADLPKLDKSEPGRPLRPPRFGRKTQILAPARDLKIFGQKRAILPTSGELAEMHQKRDGD